MSAAAIDELAQVLAGLRARFGENAFADRRRIVALLSDYVPDAKREIRALATAIDEGVPGTLARTERHLAGVEMDRLASRLEGATGLRPDLARQVVRAYAFALALGPLPSVYGDGGPAAPPSPAPPQPGAAFPPAPSPAAAPFMLGGFSVARKWAYAAGLGTLALVAAGNFLLGSSAPTPTGAASAAAGYADELTDFGVAEKASLESNVGSPTPLTLPVGKRITTGELQRLIASDPSTTLIDVLGNPHPSTLPGAKWLPEGGTGGSLEDSDQRQFAAALTRLTAKQAGRPLVFFCAGAACWESYNAVLRANAARHRNLYWYRGGLAAWSAAGLPMMPLPSK